MYQPYYNPDKQFNLQLELQKLISRIVNVNIVFYDKELCMLIKILNLWLFPYNSNNKLIYPVASQKIAITGSAVSPIYNYY